MFSRGGAPIPATTRSAIGLAVAVFAGVALSGPGRIDIVDGQTRYEVSRSIVDNGDSVIRNPEVWFGVFPGRNGQRYTYYRFPQSLAGVAAVVAADATGKKSEPRRHFFFVLTSAAGAAVLAVLYFKWFLTRGRPPRSAMFWAIAGIVCTPSWYYGTSTFDDILGALVVTAALMVALAARTTVRVGSGLGAGLLFGLAFNCKQPLVAFALAGLFAVDDPSAAVRNRASRAARLCLGLIIGIAVYAVYDLWKFPPGTKAAHTSLLQQYYPVFTGDSSPMFAALCLAISPAAGALWYFPPVFLCIHGVRRLFQLDERFAWALVASIAVFVGFICSISFFKGDPAWGPRYLVPVFAILWLWAPEGAARLKPGQLALVLVLGLGVQVASLTVDPYRLYISRGLSAMFGAIAPALYFDPANSHLLNRPREVVEIWTARHDPGEAFVPWGVPTATVTTLDKVLRGPLDVERYKVLNSLRPWWASQWYVREDQRPVSIRGALAAFLGLFAAGALLTSGSFRHPP
jgi:hypothetical protein